MTMTYDPVSGQWYEGYTTPSYDPETGKRLNTENAPTNLWNANATDWTRQVSAAPAGANLLTPEDWYNWGKGQPGYFGTYQDPATGVQKNTPAPPSLVPGGYSQQYNQATGRWDVSNDSIGGLLGWIEQNPYMFAALAATSLIGAPALAAAAPAASAGEAGLAAGTSAGELALPAAEGGGGLFGTGVTGTQALQGLSLANSARNLAQNPSGASAGGLLGSAVGAYTGVPGLGAAGSFAGGGAQDTFQGGSGGREMAEDTGGTGTGAMDWINALGPLLTSGVGLTGSALSLAAMPEVLKRLETLYNQSQGNFAQQTQYAQMYQALLDHYHQQQQQQFQTETGQTAEDRAARQQAYQAQTGERALDRSNIAQANVGRAGIAGRLSDPSQVAAGAQQIYQPMSQAMTDNLLRGVQRDLAMRGQSDGGAASRATADAMAPYYNQLQQQAMQNFLSSQGQALGAYNPLTGPYTGDAPQGPYAPKAPQPPQPAQLPGVPSYVPGSNTGPQANQAGAYQGLSNQVAQLGKLLFGNAANSPGAVALLSKLFGGGQGGQPDAGTSTEFLGQKVNTDFMNSFGGQGTGGGGDVGGADLGYYELQ